MADAANSAIFEQPTDLARLVGINDPSVIAVFEDALTADNGLIVLVATRGLILAGETSAIPQIQGAAEAAPSEVAMAIADALEDFATAEAQAAADAIRASKSGN